MIKTKADNEITITLAPDLPGVTTFEYFLNFFGIAPRLKTIVLNDRDEYFSNDTDIIVSEATYQDLERLFPCLPLLNFVAKLENDFNSSLPTQITYPTPLSKATVDAYIKQLKEIDTPIANYTRVLLLCNIITNDYGDSLSKLDIKRWNQANNVSLKNAFSYDNLNHKSEQILENAENRLPEYDSNKQSWAAFLWRAVTAPWRVVSNLINKIFIKARESRHSNSSYESPQIIANKQHTYVLDNDQITKIKRFYDKKDDISAEAMAGDLCKNLEDLFNKLQHMKDDPLSQQAGKHWASIIIAIDSGEKEQFNQTVNIALEYIEGLINTPKNISQRKPTMLFSSRNTNDEKEKAENGMLQSHIDSIKNLLDT